MRSPDSGRKVSLGYFLIREEKPTSTDPTGPGAACTACGERMDIRGSGVRRKHQGEGPWSRTWRVDTGGGQEVGERAPTPRRTAPRWTADVTPTGRAPTNV